MAIYIMLVVLFAPLMLLTFNFLRANLRLPMWKVKIILFFGKNNQKTIDKVNQYTPLTGITATHSTRLELDIMPNTASPARMRLINCLPDEIRDVEEGHAPALWQSDLSKGRAIDKEISRRKGINPFYPFAKDFCFTNDKRS